MIVIDIVEDNLQLAEGLRQRLAKEPGFTGRAIFPDATSALAAVPAAPPDVLIVDLNLPDLSGSALIARLKPNLPQTQFLVLTMYEDTGMIFEALKAGATGYLLKRASAAELADAIREIHAGGAPMSPSIARQVVQSFLAAPVPATADFGLSTRENAVLDLLSQGDLYKEVAEKLHISIDTVRSHVRKIYEKLQVHSRSQAVAKFLGERK
jgi:DNA-binding NarL/FixJ family response regulator